MGKMIFETQRLWVRELEPADLQDLAEILQDPAVMYAYEHDFSDQDVRQWLDRQLARYRQYGFGLWALIRKDDGQMVGQAGLTIQPCEGDEVLEIGYLLKRRFWHQGYAREAALGCKEYAFTVLQAPKVHSVIKTDNLPSIRVAESLGMKREKEFITRYYNGDMAHYLYSTMRE
jgi:ribosomal-protein-alanine N-acetyltransferase